MLSNGKLYLALITFIFSIFINLLAVDLSTADSSSPIAFITGGVTSVKNACIKQGVWGWLGSVDCYCDAARCDGSSATLGDCSTGFWADTPNDCNASVEGSASSFCSQCSACVPKDLRNADQKTSGTCGGTPHDTGNPPNRCQTSPYVQAHSQANLKSGNLYHSQDVGKLTLSYNSIDIYNGSLGGRWIHNYDQKLTVSGSNMVLKNDDGNIIYFRLSGNIYYPEDRSGDTSSIVKNTNGSFTRTTKTNTTYNYNTTGLLTSIIDRNGNTTTLTYSGGYLSSITDQNGRTTNITTTGGKITGITDPAGRINTLAYNTKGMLTSITDPQGFAWQYTYDNMGKMLTKKDPANNTITYTYDTSGKLLTSTDPQDKIRTMNYTQSGASTFTEKDGGLWTYTYDPVYVVKTTQTDPLGNTTRYTYDSKRNLLTTTTPDGGVTTNTYDAASNLTTVTDPLGKVTTYTYNSLNLVTTITDPNGHITRYGYDAIGNVTSITDATNAITQYQYDTKGNITAIINPLGKITNMTYDQYNNLITVTDPMGGTVTMTYDILGNMLTQKDALNNITTFVYNSLNQMTQVTDPLGKITRFTYDYKGNRLSTTDANTNTTQYVYDYKGQLTKITDALNNITNMGYSGTGCTSCSGVDKLIALTDAKNQTTAYQYDLNGRLLKETDPLGKITTYTYDSEGNLITRTNPDNKTITYSYDLTGRLTQKTYSDGTITSFQYDNAGNMTSAGNQNITYNFTYDAVNRITQITDSAGRIIQYQYDAAGNRKTITIPDNKTITYNYNYNNLLTQILTDLGQYNFAYDAAKRRTTRTLPNGTTTTYSYDQGSRLTSILTAKGAITIDSAGYTYDNVGNRITKVQPSGSYSYTYDATYQLTQATPTGGTAQPETYTYDQVGNRLSKVPDTPPATNETTIYGFDDESRLTSVLITAGNKTKQLSFTYDPFGRRTSKTLTKDEIGTACTSPNICPLTTNYVYDGHNIVLEYQNGNITAKYTHGPNIDEPLALEKNNQTYYYHADGLGSITSLSDASGNIVQRYEYDSFGNVTATGNISQPFTFTAREYDPETGLYFYRARYYDPKAGRFITKDPIGFRGGDYNLYAYVGNNVINMTDPFGLEAASSKKCKYGRYVNCEGLDFISKYMCKKAADSVCQRMGIDACCELEKTGCMGCETLGCENDEEKWKAAEKKCLSEYLKCKSGATPTQ